jgi:type I restriction enzyme, S subunit
MSEWINTSLCNIAEIERSTIEPDAIKDGTAYVGLENIQSGGVLINVQPVTSGELASNKFRFTHQHVLFGKLRPYLAKIARPTFNGICSTDILPILPSPKLDRDYLTHFLLQPSVIDLATSRSTGANLPRLSPKVLADFQVPLPPISEQKRIAEILDQAEELRSLRRLAIAQLDELGRSVFLEMFGDPVANEKGWKHVQIADFVAAFETGKNIVAEDKDDVASRYRVLKVSAVTSLKYQPKESKAVPANYYPPESHFVRKGDLLFSRANTTELVGATAYVFETPPNLLLSDKTWRFVWSEQLPTNPLFVWFLFRHPAFRYEIGKRATGTSGSMKNISQKKVFSLRVGLPHLSLQQEFAKRIEAIEALKIIHRESLAQLDALFASLQHRAFRGEL